MTPTLIPDDKEPKKPWDDPEWVPDDPNWEYEVKSKGMFYAVTLPLMLLSSIISICILYLIWESL